MCFSAGCLSSRRTSVTPGFFSTTKFTFTKKRWLNSLSLAIFCPLLCVSKFLDVADDSTVVAYVFAAKTSITILVLIIIHLNILVSNLPRDRTTPKVILSNNSLTRLCSLKDAILNPWATAFNVDNPSVVEWGGNANYMYIWIVLYFLKRFFMKKLWNSLLTICHP